MSYSGEVLRGNTETIILAMLKEKDSYGYEILKTILDKGNGLIDIKDATIYTAFKRMEKDELISSYWGDEFEGARRKYYSITEIGKEYYLSKVKEWKDLNVIISDLILGNQ